MTRECGKSLLVLDTVTGGDGERRYARLGWRRCGVIPGYALWPQGGLCATTYFYRESTGSFSKAPSGNPMFKPAMAWRASVFG